MHGPHPHSPRFGNVHLFYKFSRKINLNKTPPPKGHKNRISWGEARNIEQKFNRLSARSADKHIINQFFVNFPRAMLESLLVRR